MWYFSLPSKFGIFQYVIEAFIFIVTSTVGFLRTSLPCCDKVSSAEGIWHFSMTEVCISTAVLQSASTGILYKCVLCAALAWHVWAAWRHPRLLDKVQLHSTCGPHLAECASRGLRLRFIFLAERVLSQDESEEGYRYETLRLEKLLGVSEAEWQNTAAEVRCPELGIPRENVLKQSKTHQDSSKQRLQRK